MYACVCLCVNFLVVFVALAESPTATTKLPGECFPTGLGACEAFLKAWRGGGGGGGGDKVEQCEV